MTTIKNVDTELAELETLASQKATERAAIERAMTTKGIDEAQISQLPVITATLDMIRKRMGLLQEDRAAIERKQKFDDYERMTRAQYDHFVALAALDDEMKAIQAKYQSLAARRAELHNENHTPAMRRAELRVSLNQQATPEERAQLQQIDARYQLKGYL